MPRTFNNQKAVELQRGNVTSFIISKFDKFYPNYQKVNEFEYVKNVSFLLLVR